MCFWYTSRGMPVCFVIEDICIQTQMYSLSQKWKNRNRNRNLVGVFDLPVSQLMPVKPGRQWQVHLLMPSLHSPWIQGLEAHSSISGGTESGIVSLFIVNFLNLFILRRLERGSKPMLTPHDGRRHFMLCGIRTCDHPHASHKLYHYANRELSGIRV